NAPIGAAPPQMAPGKGPIEFHGAPPSGNVPFGAAPGKGPIEFHGAAPGSGPGGQMPQSAGKKPLGMPGPQGAAPAGAMRAGENANGPKTLSNAADNPEITLVPAQ